MIARLKDEDVLVFGLFMVEDLVDLEGHGLTAPLVVDLAKPAIYIMISR